MSVICLISLGSILVSVVLGFILAENYFFDKVFYKKSDLHGYANNQEHPWDILQSHNGAIIEHRIKDVNAEVFHKEFYKEITTNPKWGFRL